MTSNASSLQSEKARDDRKTRINKELIKRKWILILTDSFLVNIAFLIALALRFEFDIPKEYIHLDITYFIPVTIIMIATFKVFNLYKSIWRYAGVDELISVVGAANVGTIILYISSLVFGIKVPRSIFILFLILNIMFVGGIRFFYRSLRRIKSFFTFSKDKKQRVLIIGAGKAGSMVIKEMYQTENLNKIPVGIIDDDESKSMRNIHRVPVLGTTKDIPKLAKENAIDEIIIAMPSANKAKIKEIVYICKETKCKIKTLPGVYELIDGKVDIKKIRDVDVEDLLGREAINLDKDGISECIENKTVLVTGGGGSIGSELCRQISRFKPSKLIILDIYENNVYEIQNELKRKYKNTLDLEVIIASVRDINRLDQIFDKYRPDIVFHAAAHKHVPLMEDNPTEAIKNNVFGTRNVASMSDKYGTKRFVLISTDKAVNPTNIMGATKRVAEMIVQAMDKISNTEFVAVRFGNVLGSNGSVIPLFKRQIAEGGPVTVTHENVIRYFMTIPEAAQLVIQAGAMAEGGEIFVLDMGEPVKIIDLARDLIKLSGFEPNVDINIEITGLRPGEKLYEELLMAEEGLKETKHHKIFIGKPVLTDLAQLDKELEVLEMIIKKEEGELIGEVVKKLVPTYRKVG